MCSNKADFVEDKKNFFVDSSSAGLIHVWEIIAGARSGTLAFPALDGLDLFHTSQVPAAFEFCSKPGFYEAIDEPFTKDITGEA